jgi:SAM-dependent methyltransferase
MSDPQPTDAYSSGVFSKDVPTELVRLRALERSMDPTSTALLAGLPLPEDAACLDIGAGAGSIAYWLADRFPSGRIVAVDVDPRFLDVSRSPALEVLPADILAHDFDAASFDLVYSRSLMFHLSRRDEVLRKALQWTRPGGWLVIEDFLMHGAGPDTPSEVATITNAMEQVMHAQGSDPRWGRNLPGALAGLGLIDIGIRSTPMTVGLPGGSDDFWSVSWDQLVPLLVQRGMFTQDTADGYYRIRASGFIDVYAHFISVSGRRPS